jgi:hypothetical protein
LSQVPNVPIESPAQPPQLATLGWALRRAALGILVLLTLVTLGAWLLYASIDPEDAAPGEPAPAGTAVLQR